MMIWENLRLLVPKHIFNNQGNTNKLSTTRLELGPIVLGTVEGIPMSSPAERKTVHMVIVLARVVDISSPVEFHEEYSTFKMCDDLCRKLIADYLGSKCQSKSYT